ncbi:MAG TPA: 4Fe-4S ferredoxin [Elusimicrobia bacterium]|nr:MAG: hypothetical protein A2278_07980 [Elusimicrobia bacterium RIFOXYA12_FULL_49_49]OGS10192.1 MAG: hypothetical protein A2204_04300 [Elusimicrobia bacterium RIFOXYA1_FULL_47_7]OGS15998.1 MAG: hypothetical protein A2251_02285 [Elusimicrobia bacterium RIFOXYA2_FULL_47_53]OGS26322.1 MAG: hypothetical protein A2339_02980 [Elusimicrobia bacterium RIFOXYB12_FULL_50_12]OGS29166.1 MAG: hypothetical protein A2323_04825 [Elusimicrobia bacterium RIFOXYB2_FULL_46_23]HBU69363.1 4Fe-4S ferredoxin [Elusi
MKKLFIDLEICYKCRECTAKCSYYYHPDNQGHVRCMALAAQEHVCRRCEEPPCVNACPQEALEKRADGMLDRHSMRCTSCKTCTMACPFGVIYPEIVEYKTTMCDYSKGRADSQDPVCVGSCPHNAIKFIEVEEDPKKDIYAVRNGQFFVHTVKWKKD